MLAGGVVGVGVDSRDELVEWPEEEVGNVLFRFAAGCSDN